MPIFFNSHHFYKLDVLRCHDRLLVRKNRVNPLVSSCFPAMNLILARSLHASRPGSRYTVHGLPITTMSEMLGFFSVNISSGDAWFKFELLGLRFNTYAAYCTVSPHKCNVSPLANIMHQAIFSTVLCMGYAFALDAWFLASLTCLITPGDLQNRSTSRHSLPRSVLKRGPCNLNFFQKRGKTTEISAQRGPCSAQQTLYRSSTRDQQSWSYFGFDLDPAAPLDL